MWRLGSVLFALLGLSCSSASPTFRCHASEQCTLSGQIGICEVTGLCSFPDATCPTGRRYGEFSGPNHASACTQCGNGKVDPGEECDDAAQDTTHACLPTCRFNRCGDGFVRANVEDCDDGNQIDGDGCSAQCLSCSEGDESFVVPETGHCYARYAAGHNWDDAAADCQAHRSYLVTYTLAAEQDAITARFLASSVNNHWMGLRDQSLTGQQFTWMTSEPMNAAAIHLWQPGQPSPNRTDYCGSQIATGWAEQYSCQAWLPYVCEDPGWVIRHQDNHAYRPFFPGSAFDVAQTTCQTAGGHLVVIDDADEQSFVTSQFFGTLWIGAKEEPGGPPKWSTGQPMSYQNFAPGEPNLGAGACLSLNADGLWRARSCDDAHGFVCEVE